MTKTSLPDLKPTRNSLLVEEWEPLPIRDWIISVWQGKGRVEEVSDASDQRVMFALRSQLAFYEHGIPCKRLRTWVNVMMPDEKTGFDDGYPHVHVNDKATTLVHYVDAGDNPPDLDILQDGEVVETLTPQTNQTIFIPNGVWHGVHRNNGCRPRVAMIATAYES